MQPRQQLLLLPGSSRWDFCNGSETLRPPRSTAKSEITVSRPRHQNDTIAASLWAQPGRHVMAAVDQGQAHAPPIPLAGSAVLLLFGVTLRPQLRCDPCQCGQADMWNAGAIVTRDKAFLSLVVWSPERRVRISQAESSQPVPWQDCRSAEQW